MRKSRIAAFVLFCFWLCLPLFAERSLRWGELSVEARLDSEGDLRIVERQTIVFDGDWNGAERRFRIRPGQSIRLHSLEELDATGNRIPFRQGNLDSTQAWAWHSPGILRWRARAASDPSFDNESRTYELTYTLSNPLLRRGTSYRFSHDFAFSDRPGPIDRLNVDFKIDPAWRPLAEFKMPVTLTDLPPGSSYVLTLPLQYLGTGTPRAVDLSSPVDLPHADEPRGASAGIRTTLGILFLLALAWMLGRFYLDERARGRFAKLDSPSIIDRAWLEEHVLSRRPEVVGAAWDEKTGGAEVTAMLARMEGEGKIATRVEHKKNLLFERDVLHLQKKCDLSTLPEYERRLLEALLVGKDETDSDRVRQVYKRTGFDPVMIIAGNLGNSLPWKVDAEGSSKNWKWLLLAGAAYLAGLVVSFIFLPVENTVTLIGWSFGLAVTWPFIIWAAYSWRRAVARVHLASLKWLLPASLLLYLVYKNAFFSPSVLHPVALLLLGGLTFVVTKVLFQAASTEGQAKKVAVRKKLMAARQYFVKELRKSEPNLDNSWFPYVLAFGLGENVDRWFKSYGAVVGDRGRDSVLASPSGFSGAGTSGNSSPGWTGGGGSFGGAGASGSWSSAATALASSIAAPGSSSSGSGSSSGSSSSSSSSSGSSSGGGGGGGW